MWHTAIEVRLWCDSQKMKATTTKGMQKGERETRRRLNYYGELSSFELALKLFLHRRTIVLRSTVLMLMPWNILNWVFTNKLNGDNIRYEKKKTPNRVIWSCRRFMSIEFIHFLLITFSLWPLKIQRKSQITTDFRIFQTSVSWAPKFEKKMRTFFILCFSDFNRCAVS